MACEKDVRVLVPRIDDVRIPPTEGVTNVVTSVAEVPTIDEGVETTIDPSGAAAYTKETDIYFPLEWEEQSYTDAFRGFGDSGARTAYVQFRSPRNAPREREWTTVHYGYVRHVGSGGSTRKARVVLGDWANFLTEIAPSVIDGKGGKTFTLETPVSEVFQYVARKLERQLPFIENVRVRPLNAASVGELVGLEFIEFVSDSTKKLLRQKGLSEEEIIARATPDDKQVTVNSKKTFTTNKHTLEDVLAHYTESMGLSWWFRGTPAVDDTDIELVVASDPPRPLYRNNEDVSVRENNALYELQPINEVKVVGDTPLSIGNNAPIGNGISLEGFQITIPRLAEGRDDITIDIGNDVPSDEYPVAVARYDPLYERAGGNTLRPPRVEKKVSSIEGAKQAAQKRLLDEIDNTTGGDMILDGDPQIRPFNGIESRPVCQQYVDATVEPLRFTTRQVRHVCPATERYAVECDVGVYIDPDAVSFPVATTEVA